MAYIGRQNLGGAYRQLDDISSGFDGSDTTHTMQVNSQNVTVGDVNQIILSLGGVIQKPGTDFTVSGSVLTFTTAPAANTSFFAILLGSDNGGTVTPTDASVTASKLASDIAITTTGASNFNNNVTISVADNTDTLSLISTDADATNGPTLRMFRNSSSPADDDFISRMVFSGENDASEETDYGILFTRIRDASDGTEDGQITIQNMIGGTLRNIMENDSSTTVFNDDSQDIDFRVESNGNSNMIYVDGGNDYVCIGASTNNNSVFAVEGATASNQLLVINATATNYGGDGIQRILCGRSNTTAFEFMRIFSGGGSDVEFIFRGDGNAYADESWNASGADYAEYFEWKDGNSSDEDRRGYSVVLDGNQIVKATDSDDASKIIGIISGKPAVVGDSAWNKWNNKYKKDDFGAYLRDENGYRILNEDYDETKEYVSRENRKEWDTVGLMGKLRLRKGQPTGTNWIKMRDISDTVEEWLVR